MQRKLIFCFDGTLNGRDDTVSTNILRLHRGMNTEGQMSFYFAGPGNEDENGFFAELLGGLFGYGSNEIRDNAFITLQAAYRPGDCVSVIGFSRGAAIARMFCARVLNEGVNEEHPHVTFLGCFDTVGAYLPRGPLQQGLFHDLHVHPSVLVAAHAVAIDEDRKAFIPNLMNKRDGITEVWFRGVHCDIGGGREETGLSDVAMDWMITQMELSGIKTSVDRNPNMDASVGFASGMYIRESRRMGVKIDGEWSDDEPLIYPVVPLNPK